MPPIDLLVQTETASPIRERQGDTGVDSSRIQPKARKKDGIPAPGRPQDALLYDLELPFQRTFYPLGFAVEIMTNDPDVLIAANDRHERVRPGPARRIADALARGQDVEA